MRLASAKHLENENRSTRGFTLIELLVVIVIVSILIALLIPVISGAVRTANSAAVSAQINTLSMALESFKSKYGDYPPSRVLLSEMGAYGPSAAVTATTTLPQLASANMIQGTGAPTFSGTDITALELLQRTSAALRKFWPRSIAVDPTQINGNSSNGPLYFPDFNGNGTLDAPFLYLEGPECLAFFLGGIPTPAGSGGTAGIAMRGFAKDPRNPFKAEGEPGQVPPAMRNMVTTNRDEPIFEFRVNNLWDHDGDIIPGAVDSLAAPDGSAAATPQQWSTTDTRFIAYFSNNLGRGYDPNDVNLPETDDDGQNLLGRGFKIGTTVRASYAPNPYTSGLPADTTSARSTTFYNAQKFQLISPGIDRNYGLGGVYDPNSNDNKFADDGNQELRRREKDNLTNFASSRLD